MPSKTMNEKVRLATPEQLQQPVLVRSLFEKIAQGWDECDYDDVKDIGAVLRGDFDRLACYVTPDLKGEAILTQDALEQIATGWDGCFYDAVGGAIDIGDALRIEFKRKSAMAVFPETTAADDALIINAVTVANVKCVHPTADTTLDIGRVVLAAYRAEIKQAAGSDRNGQGGNSEAGYDATVTLLRKVVDYQHAKITALEKALMEAGAIAPSATQALPTPPIGYILVPQVLPAQIVDEIGAASFDLDDAARALVKEFWSRALGTLNLYAPQISGPKGFQFVPRELPAEVIDAIVVASDDLNDTARQLVKEDWACALGMIQVHAMAQAQDEGDTPDERSLFETWTVDGGWPAEHSFNLARRDGGRYIDGATELCWLAWQFRARLGRIGVSEERGVFEAWTKNGGNRLTHVFSLVRVGAGGDGDRSYLETDSELCWLAWQGRGARERAIAGARF